MKSSPPPAQPQEMQSLRRPPEVSISLWSPTGEFGAVMEGQLNQDDSILKVAVKTMKSESVHACAHMWDPHPLISGPFPVPLRKQKNRKGNSNLAQPQNLSVSGQEMESLPGPSTEGT